MHDILLETGTNEAEFLEFYLQNQSYGVNVAKVKQLIRYQPEQLTRLPEGFPSVEGSLSHLDRNIPIVNLSKHLKQAPGPTHEHQIVIITDFNNAMTGFIVDGVNKIHRITWDQLQPVSAALEKMNPRFTGIVLIDEREIVVLDFEYILDDLRPDLALAKRENLLEDRSSQPAPNVASLAERRATAVLLYAEDSALFRQTMLRSLKDVGYHKILAFENGKDLYHHVLELQKAAKSQGKRLLDQVHLVLTDIEMPQLDGLSLCKKMKDLEPGLAVVVLSSLITEQMSLKCQSVGANANISKKNLNQLLKVIDQLALS